MDLVAYILLRPWLTAGVVLILGAFLIRRIQLFLQLRHINGPLLFRLTGIPHTLALLSDDYHNWYTELHQKYGELVVVSPTIVITSSHELWARSNTYPGYKKSGWYYKSVRYDWRRDNVFTETSTEKHKTRRKQMIRGYSGLENLTLDGDIEACVVKLLNLIRTRYAGKRKSMDLAQKLLFFTLDVISTIGFGKCYGLLIADEDPDEFVDSIHKGLKVCDTQIALGTWWVNWIPFVGPRPNPDVESKGFYKMSQLNEAMVEAREKEFNEYKGLGHVPRADMLTSFMKKGLSGEDLKNENILQVVAGSDTTAGALRGTMLYLLTNPRVYKALQAEIDEAVASGKAPRAPHIITSQQAKELKYLQAIIKESMRIFPPVNNPLSRDTPPEGDTVTIDGREVYLPGGINVVPSFKAMHRNKNVYGEDADVNAFRPERWIEETDEARRKKSPNFTSISPRSYCWASSLVTRVLILNEMNTFHTQPLFDFPRERLMANHRGLVRAMNNDINLGFGHGRWLCLGKMVAMRELSVVLFELFRNFDWTLDNPEKPWKHAVLTGLRTHC
ncbi:cytochrome protein [Xylaria digitata]|nr:cytochrome protein [Xylaria digitata]